MGATQKQTTGFSIHTWTPTIDVAGGTYTPRGSSHGAFQVSDYRHVIEAMGGFWEARMSVALPMIEIEAWLQDGLNRHVEVYDETETEIFEGFVDEIGIAHAGLTLRLGPVLDVVNAARLRYSTVDTSTSPPTTGVTETTALAQDTASQSRYGLLYKTLSTGGSTAAAAAQVRDAYLAERAKAGSQVSYSGGGGDLLNLDVTVVGYGRRLTFAYRSTTTGLQNLSAKITAILNAEPHGLFSIGQRIATNTLQVGAYEADDPDAWGLLKGLVARGDAALNRYLFGIYEARAAVYEAASTDVLYQLRLGENRNDIYTPSGETVEPWLVRPGRWLRYADFLVGADLSLLQEDPRLAFLETVTFEAPRSVTFAASTTTAFARRLAQMGLSGVGG